MSDSRIELSKVLSKAKKKKETKKGKDLSIEVVGSFSPEFNIVILRDKK